jgi:hypothetical protein
MRRKIVNYAKLRFVDHERKEKERKKNPSFSHSPSNYQIVPLRP